MIVRFHPMDRAEMYLVLSGNLPNGVLNMDAVIVRYIV